MPYIRRAEGWELAFGEWVVGRCPSGGLDFWMVPTRSRAVRFLLWRCGLPKPLSFLGTDPPGAVFDLLDS